MGHPRSHPTLAARDRDAARMGHPRSHPTLAARDRDAARMGHPVFPFHLNSATFQLRSGTVGWKEGCAPFFGVLKQEHSSLLSWAGLSFMQSG